MEGKVRESVCVAKLEMMGGGGGVRWGGGPPMAGERNAHTSEEQRLSPGASEEK